METKTITRDELAAMLATESKIKFIDVRDKKYYDDTHIAGAISLPLLELREKAPTMLPQKDETIVIYCVDENCPKAEKGAKILTSMGYTNVFHYAEGIIGYMKAGLPIEKKLPATPEKSQA